ncbi:hypothetical protein DNU06_13975 [Putridiphycobacter roseus]|uniref:Outer membrane protein beta-barrel domain-containing protein n=1 Tax=Putridiphycobacter roseus TaxID=2219161 RepID=A0A2W1NKP2_9FLAO|nr:hypothetical protein [Putridiphycobacter roseus]PZE16232.1 hypothetical protein DNU06_13975 [Putridiphycobacter roseus]
MHIKGSLFLLIFITLLSHSNAQVSDIVNYKPYDNSFISPEIRQKHGFSIGGNVAFFTNKTYLKKDTLLENGPLKYNRENYGLSLGYHYLFIRSKKMTLSKKRRDELAGINLYLNGFMAYLNRQDPLYSKYTTHKDYYTWSQFELRATYLSPFFSFRGKLFSLYFINEFGFSLFYRNMGIYDQEFDKKFKSFFCVSPLNIKLGKMPLIIKSSINVAMDSNPLQRAEVEANVNLGLQIYFYKYK